MKNTANDLNFNIEELNKVLDGIQGTTSTPSLQDLINELEGIARKQNVTTKELFDLAETSQMNFELCSKVLNLNHQIKKLK
jgi:hypothetical protein